MNTGFFSAVSGFKFTSRKHRISDDDAVDRVNSFYAPVLIVLMSSVVMTKMYLMGDPVQCWIPREFKPAWEQYAESFCWLKNTYFVPLNASIPEGKEARQKEELNYYQWVPFVLAIQALMFYLPSVIWKLLNWQSGVQLKSLVAMAVNSVDDDAAEREKKIEKLAWHFQVSVVKKVSKSSGFFYKLKLLVVRYLLFGRSKSGRYLTTIYMLVKLLYVANVVGQFFVLNSFLGTDYKLYGLDVVRDLWYHHDWRHSGHFPRVTMCDFNVRTVGNTKPITLQCVLVVNLLNEKIFIFLWFLLFFVSVVTILDALLWFFWALVPSKRFATLRKLLPEPNAFHERQSTAAYDGSISEASMITAFIRDHVQSDGAFVLRLIGRNAGEPVLRALIRRLWLEYKAKQQPGTAQKSE